VHVHGYLPVKVVSSEKTSCSNLKSSKDSYHTVLNRPTCIQRISVYRYYTNFFHIAVPTTACFLLRFIVFYTCSYTQIPGRERVISLLYTGINQQLFDVSALCKKHVRIIYCQNKNYYGYMRTAVRYTVDVTEDSCTSRFLWKQQCQKLRLCELF
jgi:hypothetical protein